MFPRQSLRPVSVPLPAEQLPTLATTTLQLAGTAWPSEGIARYLDEFQEAVLI
jgi:hypothetical protein